MLAPSQPKINPDETYILTAGRIQRAWRWSLNGNTSYGLALEATKPLLWDISSAANSPLVISTKNNTWVDIIFEMSGDISTLQPSHPLHKHSNRVYVLVSPHMWYSRTAFILWRILTSFRVPAQARSIGLQWQRLQNLFQKASTWSTPHWEVGRSQQITFCGYELIELQILLRLFRPTRAEAG
jgi:hypothetical protein